MLFVEFRFFIFFAIILAVYWSLPSNMARKVWLLLSSYVFYGSFFWSVAGFDDKALPDGWWFPFMLMASTCMDYVLGLRLEDCKDERYRRLWLAGSVFVNVGVLVYFKYMCFFLQTAEAFAAWIGLPVSPHTLKIILPVGISFYTFQSMSYTIEVFRRHRPAERSFLNLATFIAFFPQLVAGPIVRATSFLPQLAEKRRWADVDVRGALVLFMTGFFKKACISDAVAPFVDQYFADPHLYTVLSAWIAVLLYAVQIYCDFSGYTDMAIAAARLMGYELTINFDFPYFSRSITEFWRRWHISLSTWLRDYLYISLGGNRGTAAFIYRNLLLTMLLGGLWHGSRWTFVIWGGLHGLALIGHREWQRFAEPWRAWRASKFGQVLFTALTFYFVCICWIFFRAADLTKSMPGSDFEKATFVLRAFTGFGSDGAGSHLQELDPRLLGLFAGLALLHWLNYKRVFSTWWRSCPDTVFATAYGSLTAVLLFFVPLKGAPFIYFQF